MFPVARATNGSLAGVLSRRRCSGAAVAEKGAAVDQAKASGATPLYIACEKGHVDAARLLLDNGAEVDRAADWGVTPLLIACEKGHVDASRLLLGDD